MRISYNCNNRLHRFIKHLRCSLSLRNALAYLKIRQRYHLAVIEAFLWTFSLKSAVLTREPLLKRKAQYSGPPCTNFLDQLISILQTLFSFFYKTSYLNEEVNCPELSTSVSVPWLNCKQTTRCEDKSWDILAFSFVTKCPSLFKNRSDDPLCDFRMFLL